MPYEYDLFISYSHHDKECISRIAHALADAGLRVWWDHQMHGGDEILPNIQDAMANSRAVAIAISRSSMKSPWVTKEYQLAMVQDIESNGQRPVIPLKLDDTPIPGFLRLTRWIAFEDESRFDSGLNDLVAAVQAIGGVRIVSEGHVPPLHEIISDVRSHLTVSGHTLDKFASDKYVKEALIQLLHRGGHAALVLLNPYSSYAKAHEPFHVLESRGSSQQQIMDTINFLRSLCHICNEPAGLDVMLTNYMPRFRTILVDTDLCYVSLYMYGEDVGEAPEMALRRGDSGTAGQWFETISDSIDKMLKSTDVIHLIRQGRFNEDWAATRIHKLLLECPSTACCRLGTHCWDEVRSIVLAYQNRNTEFARHLGVCPERYEAGTYRLEEIRPDAAFLATPQTFDTWLDDVIDDELEAVERMHPDLLQRMSRSEAAWKAKSALKFMPPGSRALYHDIWVQEYSDIIRRLIAALLAGDPDYELNLYPALTTERTEFVFSVLQWLERAKSPSLHDWLRLSVAAGLLGVDEKSPHAATSAIDSSGAIRLDQPGADRQVEAQRVADQLWTAANSECRIDASAVFLRTLDMHHDTGVRIVSFPDDYLETIVLLRYYEQLLQDRPWVQIDCVPRSTRCSNDATYHDVREMMHRFTLLQDERRFRVSRNGPKIGGVNLLKLHPSILELIDGATLVDVRGARNYEMMQGIGAETYFGFMVCREMSESITGLSAHDTPFVYIRHNPGDVSFRGFRQRHERRENDRMLAEVTLSDQKQRWEGGHLAAYDQWKAERQQRFHMLHQFYGPNAVQFQEKYGDVLEIEVQAALNVFSGRVLVIGCGAGKEVAFLSANTCDAWGIDFSPEAIMLARRALPHLRHRFLVEDMYNLDTVLEGQFDGIVANAVLLHLFERADLLPALRSIFSRLKSKGLAFVRIIDKDGIDEEVEGRQFNLPRWFVYFTADELRCCAEQAGFSVEKLDRRDHARYIPVHWVSVLLRKP